MFALSLLFQIKLGSKLTEDQHQLGCASDGMLMATDDHMASFCGLSKGVYVKPMRNVLPRKTAAYNDVKMSIKR